MDFAYEPEDIAFRNELRTWLDEQLPKFLADWDGDEDPSASKAARIECRPIRDIVGDEMFNEVWFTDVRIPADYRLGDDGQGRQVAMGTLGRERVGTAGLTTTMAADLQAMISAARAVNPDALTDPAIRERIARAYTDIEFTKLLNYRALTKVIKGQKNWPEVPLAKLQWSHLAQTLAELAIDMLGPSGLLAKGGPDAVDGGNADRALLPRK